MSNQECQGRFGPSHEPKRQEPLEYCETFQGLLQSFKDYANTGEHSDSRLDELSESAGSLCHQTILDNQPYRLLVSVAPEVSAQTSVAHEEIDPTVRQFDASQLVFMGFNGNTFQVDFCAGDINDPSAQWFTVFGYDIQLEPIFPE